MQYVLNYDFIFQFAYVLQFIYGDFCFELKVLVCLVMVSTSLLALGVPF